MIKSWLGAVSWFECSLLHMDRAAKRNTMSLVCGQKRGFERARLKNAIRIMELSLKPKHIFVIGDIFPF